jgi:hypothetical protein
MKIKIFVLPRKCLVCKKTFKPKDNQHVGKYCSKNCYWRDMSTRREKKTSAWKNKVSYAGIHKWINRTYGKPNYCEFCEKTDCKKYQWANISNMYLRNKYDWMRLCQSCHSKWDRLAQKKWITQNKSRKHGFTGIDFDGTICDRGNKIIRSDNFMNDPPMVGAKDAIEAFLNDGNYCYVFTARKIEDWRHIAKWMFKNNISGMPIHNRKLKGTIRFIDDRAIRFTNWQDIRKYFG